MTNQSRDDSELEALLARKSDISRAWRAMSADEPSVAVDDTVRAAARRAVRAGPRASRTSFTARWRVPLSIAAVLVVSASLTLLISEEKQHLPGTNPQDLPRASPPPRAEPNVAPAKRDEEARGQAGSPRVLLDKVAPSQSVEEAAPVEKAASAETAGRVGKESGAPDSAKSKATAPAAEATAVMPEVAAPAPDRTTSSPESGAPGRNDSPSVSSDARANAELKRVLTSPAQPAPQGAGTEATAKRKVEQEAASPLPPAAVPAAPPARAGAPAQLRGRAEATSQSAVEDNLAPEVWIERILDLRRAGKLQEAADSLEAFRHRYPDFQLPQELSGPR